MNVHLLVNCDSSNTIYNLEKELYSRGNVKNSSFKNADYLIIVVDNPVSGIQKLSPSLESLISLESGHIDEGCILLLGQNNTLSRMVEDAIPNIYFSDNFESLSDIFGTSNEIIKEEEVVKVTKPYIPITKKLMLGAC